MPRLDMLISVIWISGLAGVLVGRAVLAWLRYRDAARYARLAARLASATRREAPPAPVIDLRPRMGTPALWKAPEPAEPTMPREA